MGLEDLVDDSSSSNSSSTNSDGGGQRQKEKKSTSDEPYKTVGSPPNRKSFSKERWEDVKQYVHEEMEPTLNEVLNSPAQKRYEMLHEAAIESRDDDTESEKNFSSKERCVICGKDATNSSVEISGETVHTHHTVAQLENELPE